MTQRHNKNFYRGGDSSERDDIDFLRDFPDGLPRELGLVLTESLPYRKSIREKLMDKLDRYRTRY
jgi:hypothetical protein